MKAENNHLRLTDPLADWVNPKDLPADITPLERAIIAARNIRKWTDWMLETAGSAPEKGDELIDVGNEPS